MPLEKTGRRGRRPLQRFVILNIKAIQIKIQKNLAKILNLIYYIKMI